MSTKAHQRRFDPYSHHMNYKDYQTKQQDTFVEKMSKLAFLGWIAAIITITITYLL